MESYGKATFSLFMFMLLTSMWVAAVTPVVATETLVWEQWVYSSGVPVTTSIVLEHNTRYRIAVSEIFWYNWPSDLAADAQYYTKGPNNHWIWLNAFPAPGGASFLQIDGMNVSWGPFSNGDTGHTYSIYYWGKGAAITFRIVDWIDGDIDNNVSHLVVRIYLSPVVVGGTLLSVNKLRVLAPYLVLAGLAGALPTVLVIKRKLK